MEYLLGIDLGTSSTKVGLFDTYGHAIAFSDEAYPLYTPKSGWVEQDINDWWNAIKLAVHKVVSISGVDVEAIVSVSVDTASCTVILADKNMNILRPALLWMDTRATMQAKIITDSKHDALKQNGYGSASVESMPAKMMWVKQNEPDIYEKTVYAFDSIDWLMYRLTGQLTASLANAGPRWYYDTFTKSWPVDFYKTIGMEDLLEKFPKRVLPIGTNLGKIDKSAAKELGLSEKTIVAEGGLDAYVGMIGLGVINTSQLALVTGTSHLMLGLTDKEVHSPGMWGSYLDAVVPGLQLVEGGQVSTGAIINWYKTNFCANVQSLAKERNCSVYDILNAEAAKLPIGADGLLLLDFFNGNRTPYADPDIRGNIYGLSIRHTLFHIYRAIIEGICYGTNNLYHAFLDGGVKSDSIYISGGAVNSDFWVQTHANVCGLPVYITEVGESCCFGSAILGAVSLGIYSSFQDAVENMVRVKREVEPSMEAHEEYKFYYEHYLRCYNESKDWMHSVTNHLL